MYIGPWQEYNLSKQSKQTLINASTRNDIEKAIYASLDPEAAKLAIQALNPVLNQKEQNQGSNSSRRPPHNRRNSRNNRNIGFLPPISSILNPNNEIRFGIFVQRLLIAT